MNELRPHGRELIAAARRERTPSAEQRQRVLGVLLAGTTLASTASAVAAPSLVRRLVSGAGKWWLVAGVGATLGTVAHFTIDARSSAAPASSPVVATQRTTPLQTPEATPRLDPPSSDLPLSSTAMATASARAERPPPARRDVSAPTLEQELLGLHAAHTAYRNGQPAQALALVAEHRRSFPRSQLGLERSTLEVLSLCGLGRQQQATQLAAKLRATARGAAAVSGLEGSCAADAK